MRIHAEALKFLASGLIAALVNVGMRLVFSLAFSYGVSIVLAYFCGMAVAFLLNRYVVFTSARHGAMRRQGLRFAIVNAASLLQVWIIGVGLVRVVLPRAGWQWHPQTAAHCIAVATPAAASYFAHKYFSFRMAADPATSIGPPPAPRCAPGAAAHMPRAEPDRGFRRGAPAGPSARQ